MSSISEEKSKVDANDYSRFDSITDEDEDVEKKTDTDSDDDKLAAMSVEEAVFNANALKEQGNNAFKGNDITLARTHYNDGLTMMKKQSSKSKDFSESQTREVNQLLIALNGNLAMVEAKQENWAKSLQYAIAVLDLDSLNVKALFRKGQACGKLGNYEQAKFELQKVVDMDANNAAAKKELAEVTRLMKEQSKKDKAAYSSMFSKGSMYEDREKEREIKLQKEREEKEKEQVILLLIRSHSASFQTNILQDLWSQSKLERREKGLPEQTFDEWKKERDEATKKAKESKSGSSKPRSPKPTKPLAAKRASGNDDDEYDDEDEKIIKETTSKGYCYFKNEQSKLSMSIVWKMS
jgi:tetratricopeptide (TPR) repeat protein